MFLARVDCIGCHYAEQADASAEFRGRTCRASEKACEKCHGERFAGVLDETRSELKTTLEQEGRKIGAAREALAAASEVGEAAGAKLADLSGLPLISGGYCATMCHPRVGVKVPPETVNAFGKEMPHGMHAGLTGCVTCHEIGSHKRVPLRPDVRTVCAGCHPQ